MGLVNDLRLHELSEFFKENQGRSTGGKLLRKTVEANKLDSLGYATSWALINYLAKYERSDFHDYLRRVSDIGPLEAAQPGSLFTEYLGSEYVDLEGQVIKHLRSLPYVDPIANQTHYVLMIYGQNRQMMITSSPQQLQRYQREKANGKQFQVQAFPNRAAANQVGQQWLRGR